MCKITHCVCKITHCVCNNTMCTKSHIFNWKKSSQLKNFTVKPWAARATKYQLCPTHQAQSSSFDLWPWSYPLYCVPPFHSLKSADTDASKKYELENRGRANSHLITIARFIANSSSMLGEAYFVQIFDAFKQIITQFHGQPSNSINPFDPLIFS